MKSRFQFIIMLASVALLSSCEKDNYAEPKSVLSGRVVYQGEPIGVEYNQVRLQLWQPGFGKLAAINAPIDQAGAYSSVLFNGNYKMVFPQGRGPFKTIQTSATQKDTIYVSLAGSKTVDVEVMPYYIFKSATFSGGESRVSVTAKLEQILKGADARDVESVTLFVNRTEFVSRATNIATASQNGEDIEDIANISLTTAVAPLTPTQDYVFARVGVKIKGIEDMLFSTVEKVKL